MVLSVQHTPGKHSPSPRAAAWSISTNTGESPLARPLGPPKAPRVDKLQSAGRDFLLRLIAKHGLAGAALVLRALADELEELTWRSAE